MIMERIHRFAYGLNECGSFIYALAHGLSEGKVDCDHKDVYFREEAFKRKEFDKNLPIPMLVNLINLEEAEREDLIAKLSEGLKKEGQRVSKYLEFSQPFIEFESHDRDYQVTKDGLVIVSYKDMVSDSLHPIPLSDWAIHDTGIDREMYWALSSANHQRFFRKFCPWFFEQNPKYAQLKEQDKKLVGEFAKRIKAEDPVNSKELEELIK